MCHLATDLANLDCQSPTNKSTVNIALSENFGPCYNLDEIPDFNVVWIHLVVSSLIMKFEVSHIEARDWRNRVHFR